MSFQSYRFLFLFDLKLLRNLKHYPYPYLCTIGMKNFTFFVQQFFLQFFRHQIIRVPMHGLIIIICILLFIEIYVQNYSHFRKKLKILYFSSFDKLFFSFWRIYFANLIRFSSGVSRILYTWRYLCLIIRRSHRVGRFLEFIPRYFHHRI